jgi:hypothetical protein
MGSYLGTASQAAEKYLLSRLFEAQGLKPPPVGNDLRRD